MPPTHFSPTLSVPPISEHLIQSLRKLTVSIPEHHLEEKPGLGNGGWDFVCPLLSQCRVQESQSGSLTRCLHGCCQLPVLLRRHVLAIGGFQGDALVTPFNVEIAARVPAGRRGRSVGCDRWGCCW